MTRKSDIGTLLDIMRRLRDPNGGCPWDIEQTFDTIAPYTIEEAYEVAGAIEDRDWPGLKEELGDLLLQVVYHARMAEERGLFDFADVVTAISDKMIARHPHVFGDAKVENAAAQTVAWEEIKRRERAAKPAKGLLDDVTRALPALLRAEKLQKRMASVGFDWDSPERVLDKITEEAGEIADARASGASHAEIEGEIGDLLFVVANLARHLKVDPEAALRVTNAKVVSRFKWIESALEKQGRTTADATLEEMETLWQEAKTKAKSSP
ncbi:MAG TPA: nucleoside triphosphate pyrophosphohydrolase [Rhizomicrobium sp.]|nr:nucleoside triphosphate pyrophosphohydrolase [Rhizomicrobium sp.]